MPPPPYSTVAEGRRLGTIEQIGTLQVNIWERGPQSVRLSIDLDPRPHTHMLGADLPERSESRPSATLSSSRGDRRP